MLENVSTELVNAVDAGYLSVSENAFRIFVVWLLYRTLDNIQSVDARWIHQVSLAEAWEFGADCHIPAFQNAVIRMLTLEFVEGIVDANGVKQAYRTAKRDTKLQQAFVAQLVSDSGDGDEMAWRRDDFTHDGMEKTPGFLLDLAVRYGSEKFPANNSMEIENFLVDEDGKDDESVTEG